MAIYIFHGKSKETNTHLKPKRCTEKLVKLDKTRFFLWTVIKMSQFTYFMRHSTLSLL